MQNLPTAVERSQGKISGILAELHGMVRMKEYYTIRYVCMCVCAYLPSDFQHLHHSFCAKE